MATNQAVGGSHPSGRAERSRSARCAPDLETSPNRSPGEPPITIRFEPNRAAQSASHPSGPSCGAVSPPIRRVLIVAAIGRASSTWCGHAFGRARSQYPGWTVRRPLARRRCFLQGRPAKARDDFLRAPRNRTSAPKSHNFCGSEPARERKGSLFARRRPQTGGLQQAVVAAVWLFVRVGASPLAKTHVSGHAHNKLVGPNPIASRLPCWSPDAPSGAAGNPIPLNV